MKLGISSRVTVHYYNFLVPMLFVSDKSSDMPVVNTAIIIIEHVNILGIHSPCYV